VAFSGDGKHLVAHGTIGRGPGSQLAVYDLDISNQLPASDAPRERLSAPAELIDRFRPVGVPQEELLDELAALILQGRLGEADYLSLLDRCARDLPMPSPEWEVGCGRLIEQMLDQPGIRLSGATVVTDRVLEKIRELRPETEVAPVPAEMPGKIQDR
jgi:hypothetical protein